MKTFYVFTCLFLYPTSALTGSHSLCLHSTYIKGKTLFPEFSYTLMLDDVVVGHFNSNNWTYVHRGNTTDEDDVIDPQHIRIISKYMYDDYVDRWIVLDKGNLTVDILVHQKIILCELLDNAKAGQMITRSASKGFTTDELGYLDGKFTYQGTSYITQQELNTHLQLSMWRHENLYYPACIKTLKDYLKKRGNQVNRKVKPRVRLIQKASDFGGFVVSCLATGFYPRHINLTLLRDGQPVSDHELTGGDLLPNGDGTYQMRKSLEIRAEEREKHKYSCTAKLLNLDNKLDIDLEFDHNEPFKSVIPLIVMVLVLMLVVGVAALIWKRRRAGHMGLRGNELADETAKKAISLNHLKKILKNSNGTGQSW
ncbi:major histocompatibility complex class I-related gene protein-like [Danio aesculapii]|uniref:major histocompatibility complex class I-related gene protein-like n=1 Tax=Danio aesculapii TaxID=1142201 RepID=UPI0024BF7AE0|nr:major histocompatibility complex class I-related gene protein-like [Danio aesculapii]